MKKFIITYLKKKHENCRNALDVLIIHANESYEVDCTYTVNTVVLSLDSESKKVHGI
jgi:hypothetical protein